MFEFFYSVELSITHPTMAPEVLTHSLGLNPTLHTKAGEERTNIRGKPLGRKARLSTWRCNLHDEPRLDSKVTPLSAFINSWIQKLTPNAGLFEKINNEGGEAQFSVCWYAGDTSYATGILESATLKKCGALGLDIELNIVTN